MGEERRLLVLTRDCAGAPFRQRIEPYLPALAERGIQAEVVELAACPFARQGQMRRAGEFSGVLLHRKTLSWWDARCLAQARRLIYDYDDAVMFQARAPNRPHRGRLRRFARTVRRANLVIAGNGLLADLARAHGARQTAVVPTGLDVRRYPPKQDYRLAGPLRLVWIGSRSTLKQLAALGPALAEIGRQTPGAVLRIIADAELHLEGLRTENVPWQLEDEAARLTECDIAIAPLPDTPYTRGKCGFKVVQYMAAGLPVIASPVGVNADYVRPEETGLHARGPQEWAAAVARLAADVALRERLGRAGRRLAEQRFHFSVLAPKFCDAVERALA